MGSIEHSFENEFSYERYIQGNVESVRLMERFLDCFCAVMEEANINLVLFFVQLF